MPRGRHRDYRGRKSVPPTACHSAAWVRHKVATQSYPGKLREMAAGYGSKSTQALVSRALELRIV